MNIRTDLVTEIKEEKTDSLSNVKTFEEKVYGQMIIQIPDENSLNQKILDYLVKKNIQVEEVLEYDFNH